MFESPGCLMIGYTSLEGYWFEEFEVARGGAFCDLLLDALNDEKLRGDWVDSSVTRLLASCVAWWARRVSMLCVTKNPSCCS